MKHLLSYPHAARLTVLLLAAVILSSCSKDTSDFLKGEWKLSAIGDIPASDLQQDGTGGLDVYIHFDGNGAFETFQRLVDSEKYVRYEGVYSIDGGTVTGEYSDGEPWGAVYTAGIEGNNTLRMSAEGETYLYDRTAIPSEVRSSALDPSATKAGETEFPGKLL